MLAFKFKNLALLPRHKLPSEFVVVIEPDTPPSSIQSDKVIHRSFVLKNPEKYKKKPNVYNGVNWNSVRLELFKFIYNDIYIPFIHGNSAVASYPLYWVYKGTEMFDFELGTLLLDRQNLPYDVTVFDPKTEIEHLVDYILVGGYFPRSYDALASSPIEDIFITFLGSNLVDEFTSTAGIPLDSYYCGVDSHPNEPMTSEELLAKPHAVLALYESIDVDSPLTLREFKNRNRTNLMSYLAKALHKGVGSTCISFSYSNTHTLVTLPRMVITFRRDSFSFRRKDKNAHRIVNCVLDILYNAVFPTHNANKDTRLYVTGLPKLLDIS